MENENLKPIEKLTPFTKMIMTIGTLPSSFYASMSYYESMVWLYEYLKNEVIPTVNNNAEAVEELQTAFTTLETFISEYFDNLDVQEEINKKLDEMAEDGSLTNLIKAYVDPIQEAFETEMQHQYDTFSSTISNRVLNQDAMIAAFEGTVGNQIAQINNKVNSATSGSPKDVYATVTDLTTADPDHDYIYVVAEDGKWYYYNTSTTSWTAGGTYQATSISDDSITKELLKSTVKEEYDDINGIMHSIPDSLKSSSTYIPTYTNEAIDSSGNVSSNSKRLATNFIPVGHGIKFTPTTDTYSGWCRAYNANYEYVTTYWFRPQNVTQDTSASEGEIDIDRIIAVNPNIKFFRIVFKKGNGSQTIESVDYTITYKKSNMNSMINEFEKLKFDGKLEFEYGAIRNSTGIDNPEYNTENIRTPFYYEIGNSTLKTSYASPANITVLEYNSSFTFLEKINFQSSGIAELSSSCKYVRFQLLNNGDLSTSVTITGLQKPIKRNYTINEDMNDCQRIWFNIKGTSYYSSSLFKLPSNYNPIGDSIPMIIFVHGSADYNTLTATTMTQNYNTLYNYLRDNGYAVWDCYGWGSYQNSIDSTEGTPFNINVYCSGVEHFCRLFNIDKENIFICGKSYGGIQELAMLYQDRLKIKGIGFLAPALSILHHGFGYSETERETIVASLGMSEPPTGLLSEAMTYPPSQAYEDYLAENIDILLSYDPYWKGLQVGKNDKLHNSIYSKDNTANLYANNYRTAPKIPIKFWFAMDDENVPINAIINLINTLKNTGCEAYSHIFPNGTGGHHCVDTDENAPQTTNVTTPLGIEYETIPTAYYEYIQFISTL